MVPGGGIEPPTRGFSIHCSTPELPGHGKGFKPWVWAFYDVLGPVIIRKLKLNLCSSRKTSQ
jgi:hypothetical protein